MSALPVALIVAAADNGIIGRDNALPWNLPADLAHFRRQTLGKPILMGRLTFESIGRPLPGRTNIVITRNPVYRAEGIKVVPSLAAALELAEDVALIDGAEELMVIGGAQIYDLALPQAQRIYMTRVHIEPAGDAHLPSIDWDDWTETTRARHDADGEHPAYSFLEYTRK